MKKKRGPLVILIFLSALLLVTLASAEFDEKAIVDKGYSCLKEKLGDNCADTSNTHQAAFSLLAMSHESSIKSECRDSLEDKEKSENCWGETTSSSCDLKSTSLAILALNHAGANVDDNIDWLLTKKKQSAGLIWFLEIDANNATQCKIQVNDAEEKTFSVGENKKISGSSSCLTPSEQDYFLRIADSCLTKNFTISCDKNFITTLLYKKPSEITYHVSSITHSAPAGDSTKEKVESYCFGISSECNYEGSLWAALALAKTGEDISAYLPYITAMSDELINKKYLPSAFLYMLTNDDDFYLELVGKQKQSYWDESGKKFYDTALALLSLQNLALEQVDVTKQYLSDVQENNGCWGTISETAFLLYALNPTTSSSGSGGTSDSQCQDPSYGYFCVSPSQCSISDKLDNFYCPSLGDVCCKTSSNEITCSEKQGIICSANQQCTETEVTAFDTNNCCLASCITTSDKSECEQFGYSCETECSSNQEEKPTYSCFSGVCCKDKDSGGLSLMWIIILIILIILVILAIIYRNRIKLWWFKRKNLITSKPPTAPSRRPMVQMPFRPAPFPQSQRRPMPRNQSRTQSKNTGMEKDFDETMRKLREMSK